MSPRTGTEYRNTGSIKHGTNSGTHTAVEAAGLCFTMALRRVDSHTRASPIWKKLSERCTKTHTSRQHLAALSVHCSSPLLLDRQNKRQASQHLQALRWHFLCQAQHKNLNERTTPGKMLYTLCLILFPTLQLGMYQKLLLALFISLVHASSWFTWKGKNLSLPRTSCSARSSFHCIFFILRLQCDSGGVQ